MNKFDFLTHLRAKLWRIPKEDAERSVEFYSEMIDDRMEEGLSEEEAVAAIGSARQIAAQAVADTPLAGIAKARPGAKGHPSTGVLLLLVLGSPIWLSLAIAVFAVVFALYISLWAAVISLWAVFASLAACSVGGLLAFIIFTAGGKAAAGAAMLAAGLICAGLSIFMLCICKAAAKALMLLTKKAAAGIRHWMIRKEKVS